ncbi:MAG: SpoIIE family protein phosphatase [Sphaerochaeta sp.]|uniref:SpoIIE family protein phosphatase n=1 Tax=Sphaerochaeta sp. TaxID=1972642 RepID=UPI001DF115A0|nr:SpoIIE family protein phosphatase [uncultured Sphaerochaeta sp.]MDD3928983.1 SpoIIE family protein phosphatase [Sphaerochaeta sp.]NCC12893.1 serine/threonine protein phosphatase [Spirochaetia bacterium]NCC88865.1 serine/threonine protein phosphatase [Spirochaetia bacterium]
MNDIFIDVDYAQIYKHGQKIGGDVFLLSRNPENDQIVCTLSDGLGSGVKANVLASLTARMAHKLSFSPMDLTHSARIIMNTLPVCKERKISYATFTIADIRHEEGEEVKVNLVEYDNPSALVFRGPNSYLWQPERIDLEREGAFKQEVLGHSQLKLSIGSRLVIFSDGVTQAGMGKALPLGWRLEGVRSFAHDQIEANPDISSHDLAQAIVCRAHSLDRLSAKDDITCMVVYVRKPRRTLVVTGPPFTPEHDQDLVEKIRHFEGKKIVSGGTTAQIVSRLLEKPLKVDMSCWSPQVPPCSTMEGIDLVTEGMLTLSKVAIALEQKKPVRSLPNDAVRKFIQVMQESDQVHFIVGTKINEAHQDPNIPVEIGIRRTLIGRLRKALEDNYLKETSQEYI